MDNRNENQNLAEVVPMDNRNVKRKLAAIVSTDVKDYSRLMADNEVETIKSIKACRKLISQQVWEHQGRVVDSPGDNILSEFSSVTSAVECAVEIQKALLGHNKDIADDRKMEFRIGINLGDIIEDDRRIYGDGLNIAARLEGVADGGGICISGSAYDQVKNKLPLGYEFLGNQELKNIAEPVPVYRVLTDPESVGKLKYKCIKDNPRHKIIKRITALVILFLIIFVGGFLYKMKTGFTPGEHRKMIKEKIMSLRIPDKPSIAVLPFTNMSGDKEQDYFSDGLTEDLITDLSKVSGLFVIARNSVFAYKGKNVKVDKIGRELGVKYVLEGSIRKMGDRVRITAQLIDTKSEGHVWAERYDRDLHDIFSLQDEVREKIVKALAVQMTTDDEKRIMMKDTDNLEAYDYYLKSSDLCDSKDLENLEEGRKLLRKAIALDPNFAKAYAALGKTYFTQWVFGGDKDMAILNKVYEYGQKAITINKDEPSGYSQLAHYYLWTKQHDSAIEEIQKAIDLDPNNSQWLGTMGELQTYAGNPESGITYLKKAMRLDPKYPSWLLFSLGQAYWLIKDYDLAVETFKKSIEHFPSFWPSYLLLAICYDEKGMKEESQKYAKKALEENENLPFQNWEQLVPFKDPAAAVEMVKKFTQIGVYKKKDAMNLEAHGYYRKAYELSESKNLEELEKGRELLLKAISLDPNFAKAYSAIGKSYFMQWLFGTSKDLAILNKVFEYGQKSISIDRNEASGYDILAHYYLWTKQHDLSIEQAKKAITLDPNNSEWQATYGEVLSYSGKPKEGIEYLLKAMQLNPKHPVWYLYSLGHAYFLVQDYDKAILSLEQAAELDPGFWPSYLILAMAYDANGMKDQSQKAVEKVLEKNENLVNENWEQKVPYKDPGASQEMMEALKKVGISE